MNFTKPYDNYLGRWFKSTQTNAFGFLYKIDNSTIFRLRFLDMQPYGDGENGWSVTSLVEVYKPTQADYHKSVINVFKCIEDIAG